MKISIGIIVSIITLLMFGGVATSSIAEGKKSLSKQAKEKAILHQEKGSKLDDEGEFDSAVSEYKKSLELDPENPDTLFNLGVLYLKINKAEDGINIFEKLTKLLPKDNEVFNLLGIAYSGVGKKSEVVKVWEKSLSIQPDQQKVKEMIAEIRTASAEIKK